MIVVLAHPYEGHPPDASVDLPERVARQLIHDGLARAPAGVDYRVDMGFDGALEGADGDLMRMRQAGDTFHDELYDDIKARFAEAIRWADANRPPRAVVNAVCCGKAITRAMQTPAGTVLLFRLRRSDVDGRYVSNGRTLPLVGRLADVMRQAPPAFVDDPLIWVGEALPWPAPLPAPRTLRARCPHNVYAVDLTALADLLTTARPGADRRMLATRPDPR